MFIHRNVMSLQLIEDEIASADGSSQYRGIDFIKMKT